MRFATLALAATALAATASAQSDFTCEFWGENEDMEEDTCAMALMPWPAIPNQATANGLFEQLGKCECKSLTSPLFRWQVAHCAVGSDIARNQGAIDACDAGETGRVATFLNSKIKRDGVTWMWKDIGGGNPPPPPPPPPAHDVTTTAHPTPTATPIVDCFKTVEVTVDGAKTITPAPRAEDATCSITYQTTTVHAGASQTPTVTPIVDCVKTVLVTVDGAKTITPTPRAEDATCSITYQTTIVKDTARPAYPTVAPIADCFKTIKVTVEQHATATTTITPSPRPEDATCSITYKTTTVVGDDCTTTTTAAPAGPTAKPEYQPEYSGAGRLVVGVVAAVAGALALLF
ncbi:hypothetical protein HDU88_005671 [Geranomyces variabilis]|nr:hypothetical protein HDU88_005671 [Geranomyces variabilis]